MSEVFFSYAREDRDRVERLALAFEDAGLDVWWDRKISPGDRFEEVIEQAIDAAHCVVVVWSIASVGSDWVKTEAAEGLETGKLIARGLLHAQVLS